MHGAKVGGGGAVVQIPPQWPLCAHVVVALQVDGDGQQPLPTTHLCGGGIGVGVGKHSPPQTIVCIQIEPVGHP